MTLMKRPYFILLTLLILASCNTDFNNDRSARNIQFDLLNENYSRVDYGDMISKTQIVQLETVKESLLAGCDKLEVFQGNFYILDRKDSKVVVFDSNGLMLFSSKEFQGKGPGEYYSLYDFDINRQNGNIYILDVVRSKIVEYSIVKGSIQQFSYHDVRNINAFKMVNEMNAIFLTSSTEKGVELLFYSLVNHDILQGIEDRTPKVYGSTNNAPFRVFNDSLFYNPLFPSYSNYFIDTYDMVLKKQNMLTFPNFQYEKGHIPTETLPHRAFMLDSSDKYAFVLRILENSKVVVCFYVFENQSYIALFDKDSGEMRVKKNVAKHHSQILAPDAIDEVFLYKVSEEKYIEYLVDERGHIPNYEQIKMRSHELNNPCIIKYALNYD